MSDIAITHQEIGELLSQLCDTESSNVSILTTYGTAGRIYIVTVDPLVGQTGGSLIEALRTAVTEYNTTKQPLERRIEALIGQLEHHQAHGLGREVAFEVIIPALKRVLGKEETL